MQNHGWISLFFGSKIFIKCLIISFSFCSPIYRYFSWLAYGQSKLSNILHAKELARRLKVHNMVNLCLMYNLYNPNWAFHNSWISCHLNHLMYYADANMLTLRKLYLIMNFLCRLIVLPNSIENNWSIGQPLVVWIRSICLSMCLKWLFLLWFVNVPSGI